MVRHCHLIFAGEHFTMCNAGFRSFLVSASLGKPRQADKVNVNVNVNNLLAISI